MRECICCSRPATIGCLCGEHARKLSQCDDITSEQLQPREVSDATAQLVDQWGATHELGTTTLIGRSPADTDIVILHASVSSIHARLEQRDGTWYLSDLKSLNGTRCNDQQIVEVALADGDRIGIGSVSMYFTTKMQSFTTSRGRGRTTRTGEIQFSSVQVLKFEQQGDITLEWRANKGVATRGDQQVELTQPEYRLLRCLIDRRRNNDNPDQCYLTWQELARLVIFNARDPDSENVRELVRRVRRKLKRIGVTGLIDSKQGAGYRLSPTIDVSH